MLRSPSRAGTQSTSTEPWALNYFDSAVAEGIICGGFLQIASTHFALLRDIFLLLSLLTSLQNIVRIHNLFISNPNPVLSRRTDGLQT